MDRFYRAYLVIIVVLLAIVALHPIATPQTVKAAEHYEYRVVQPTQYSNEIQAELNKRAAEGWDLAEAVTKEGVNGVILILRKPVQ